MSDTEKRTISIICYLAVVLMMVLLSIMSDEREVIFPEVGAIAAGMFLTPHRSWMTNGRRMFALLLVGGVIGMGIVRFLPLPVMAQMITGYIAALLIQSLSGTSFVPMISALVLPVLLQTRSIWYLISLVIFSLTIIGIRKLLEKMGIKGSEEYIPMERSIKPSLTVFRIIMASIMIAIALGTGLRFIAAPPLLVAFTELSAHNNRVIRLHPIRVIMLMLLSSASGAWVRLLFAGLPACFTLLAVLISTMIFLVVFYNAGPMVPPAGAVMVLAYLVPEKALLIYPLEILIGIGAFVGVCVVRERIGARV